MKVSSESLSNVVASEGVLSIGCNSRTKVEVYGRKSLENFVEVCLGGLSVIFLKKILIMFLWFFVCG